MIVYKSVHRIQKCVLNMSTKQLFKSSAKTVLSLQQRYMQQLIYLLLAVAAWENTSWTMSPLACSHFKLYRYSHNNFTKVYVSKFEIIPNKYHSVGCYHNRPLKIMICKFIFCLLRQAVLKLDNFNQIIQKYWSNS